jgi:hypothetical protein
MSPIILQSLNDPTGQISATAESICTEGLKKAGYSTSSTQWSTLLDRAESSWLEEVKADIVSLERKLHTLKTYVDVTGVDTYTFATDYCGLGDIWALDSDGMLDYQILGTPAWESSVPYVKTINVSDYKSITIRINYFVDLTLVALNSALLDALYRKYRNTFIQGVYWKALDNKNDTRAEQAQALYLNYVKLLVSRERDDNYFNDNVPLQCKVVDY